MVKKLLLGIGACLSIVIAIAGVGVYWVGKFSLSDDDMEQLRSTQAKDIDYLSSPLPPSRGRVLAIVSSVRELGSTGRPTGYELTELARAYWVFTTNGFEVDIASPQGGEPYALLDDDDMGRYDYAFLNDDKAQLKAKNTLKLSDVKAEVYDALYFVGGKGAMFDFPDNAAIQDLLTHHIKRNGVVAAVCHGPAALVNLTGSNGGWWIAGKTVTSFTNAEELLLIPNAESVFPFLLQNELEKRGAKFAAGPDYLENVVVDEGLITGQNPWSVWRLAEETVRQLGYDPLPRTLTPEEHSVALLETLRTSGLDHAEKQVRTGGRPYHAHLVLMHAIVAFMNGEVADGVKLIILSDSVRLGNQL